MKDLLSSKKGIMGLIALCGLLIVTVVSVATGSNWISAEAFVGGMTGIIGTYMLGQGIADAGKEKAKIENGGGGE